MPPPSGLSLSQVIVIKIPCKCLGMDGVVEDVQLTLTVKTLAFEYLFAVDNSLALST